MVPRNSLVVVNFGSHRLLERNLTPLGVLTREKSQDAVEIVVVDNYLNDVERQSVTDLGARHGWRVIAAEGNPGYGAAVNLGIRAAQQQGATAHVVLNPDARVDAGTVSALLRDVREHPRDLVAPVIHDTSGRVVFAGSEMDLASGHLARRPSRSTQDREVLTASAPGRRPWLTGACLAMHSDVFDELGGFAEDYFLYWEDVDLSIRAADAGTPLVLRRDLVVVHDEGGTQQRHAAASKSDLYYYYNCRNRLVFAGRHLPRRSALAWMVRTPRESARIWLRGGRRQALFAPGSVVAATRGSAAGLVHCALRGSGDGRPRGRR